MAQSILGIRLREILLVSSDQDVVMLRNTCHDDRCREKEPSSVETRDIKAKIPEVLSLGLST